MGEVTLAVVVPAMIYVLVNLLKELRARNWNAVVSVGAAWAFGVGVVWLVAQTRWADGATLFGTTLKSLSLADVVVLGFAAGAGVSGALHDLVKAFDNSQTAAKPSLLPPKLHQGSDAPVPPVG